MEIVKRAHYEEWMDRWVIFNRIEDPGRGFMFEADESGTPLPPKNPSAADNMLFCYQSDEVTGPKMRTLGGRRRIPAVGRCQCGHEVVLHTRCHVECANCGRMYNTSGQELRACYCYAAGRRWLEEMGERIDKDY